MLFTPRVIAPTVRGSQRRAVRRSAAKGAPFLFYPSLLALSMIKDSSNQEISIWNMVGYLGSGLQLALSKECRLYVVIPIIINFLVLAIGGYLVVQTISGFLQQYLDLLPEWLNFLSYVLWIFLALTMGFVFCYIFSTVATIIASPFYGMLAEKAEGVIRGAPFAAGSDDGFAAVIKDVPRVIKRELRKMAYYLPRVIVCLIISFIPVINVISPILWFLLAAWMMCIQYVDYPYDNHKISFDDMKKDLQNQRLASFVMGAVISLAMTVPILNLVIPPAAVCAGTKYYVEMQKRYTIDVALR